MLWAVPTATRLGCSNPLLFLFFDVWFGTELGIDSMAANAVREILHGKKPLTELAVGIGIAMIFIWIPHHWKPVPQMVFNRPEDEPEKQALTATMRTETAHRFLELFEE